MSKMPKKRSGVLGKGTKGSAEKKLLEVPKNLKKDQWVHLKHKDGTEEWLKGKSGVELHNTLIQQDDFLNKTLQPFADYDEEYDMVYISWTGHGKDKVVHTGETHTVDGKIIRFDFNKKGMIVGVEIEGLISDDKKDKITNLKRQEVKIDK